MAIDATRTTFTLPSDLLAEVDRAVRAGKARSRNGFVVAAIRRELAATDAAVIDAALAEKTSDPVYQAEGEALAVEFAVSDWQAYWLAESAPTR